MDWVRVIVAAAVVVVALLAARLIDRRMARRKLAPESMTRYRVLRRSITATVVTVGVLSALLVIPQVRAVAGAILASGAVIGLVVGFAAQKTLGNFIAGILIAFAQPLRIGDQVEVDGTDGVVEEIGLTYTFIRMRTGARLVIPNEKLASDTIRNSTIVSREKLAQVTVQVPLDRDLDAVVDLLRGETAGDPGAAVVVTALNGDATVTVRTWAPDAASVEQFESELRLRIARRLREQSAS